MPEDQTGLYIELKVKPDHACKSVQVTSEQVPGLHLMGKCMDQMRPMLETAIKRLFRDNEGADVNVIWLFDANEFPTAHHVPERLVVYRAAA